MPPLLLAFIYVLGWCALAVGGWNLIRPAETRWNGGLAMLGILVMLTVLGFLIVVPMFGHA